MARAGRAKVVPRQPGQQIQPSNWAARTWARPVRAAQSTLVVVEACMTLSLPLSSSREPCRSPINAGLGVLGRPAARARWSTRCLLG